MDRARQYFKPATPPAMRSHLRRRLRHTGYRRRSRAINASIDEKPAAGRRDRESALRFCQSHKL